MAAKEQSTASRRQHAARALKFWEAQLRRLDESFDKDRAASAFIQSVRSQGQTALAIAKKIQAVQRGTGVDIVTDFIFDELYIIANANAEESKMAVDILRNAANDINNNAYEAWKNAWECKDDQQTIKLKKAMQLADQLVHSIKMFTPIKLDTFKPL